MKRSDLRPCMVGETIKGYFHQWAQKTIVSPSFFDGDHIDGMMIGFVGIVEFEDGTVKEVYPHIIRFLDGEET